MELDKISKIQTGLMLARKKATASSIQLKEYKLLTLKSLDPLGKVDFSKVDNFLSEEKLEKRYLTQKGDIILRLTAPYTAVMIEEENILISSNFGIVRLIDSNFLQEYVALYLNSKKIKEEFSRSAVSATIPLIKISHIKQVDIRDNSLETQKKIIEYSRLQKKELRLLESLLAEKERFTNLVLNKLLVIQ
jgi:restriction endonuclease S subunit